MCFPVCVYDLCAVCAQFNAMFPLMVGVQEHANTQVYT